MVTKPIDGQSATHANSGTVGFLMSPEQVDAWHKAGIANGGRAIEDPPGVRQGGAGELYLAYLRDPCPRFTGWRQPEQLQTVQIISGGGSRRKDGSA